MTFNVTLCPSCGTKSQVVDSRSAEKSHTSVRRRRRCPKCQRSWTTYEVHAEDFLTFHATPKKIGTMIASTTSVLNFLRGFTKGGNDEEASSYANPVGLTILRKRRNSGEQGRGKGHSR